MSDSKIASWVPECLMKFFVFLNFLPTESESLRAGPGPLIFNHQNLIDVQPTLRTLPSYTASSKCHSHISNHLLNIPPGHSPASPPFPSSRPEAAVHALSLPCWEGRLPAAPLNCSPSFPPARPQCLPNPRPPLPVLPSPWKNPSSLLVWVIATAS